MLSGDELAQNVLRLLRLEKEDGNAVVWSVAVALFGVSEGCDEKTLKSAFRRIALQLHPDKNESPLAHEAFQLTHKWFHRVLSALREQPVKRDVPTSPPVSMSRPPPPPPWWSPMTRDTNLSTSSCPMGEKGAPVPPPSNVFARGSHDCNSRRSFRRSPANWSSDSPPPMPSLSTTPHIPTQPSSLPSLSSSSEEDERSLRTMAFRTQAARSQTCSSESCRQTDGGGYHPSRLSSFACAEVYSNSLASTGVGGTSLRDWWWYSRYSHNKIELERPIRHPSLAELLLELDSSESDDLGLVHTPSHARSTGLTHYVSGRRRQVVDVERCTCGRTRSGACFMCE